MITGKDKYRMQKLENSLQEISEEFSNFQTKAYDTFEMLDDMIKRESGGSTSNAKILSDYYKIGDPYINNLYVRKCINKKSEMISSIGYTIKNEGGEELPTTHPVYKLFSYINEEDSPFDFIYEIVRSLERFGKAFILLSERELSGIPIAIDVWGDAGTVKPRKKDGLLVGWEYNNNFFIADMVIFMRYKHPEDSYDGLPPGTSAAKEVLQAFYAQAYQINYFKKGAMGVGFFYDPSGKPLSSAQEKETRMAIDQTFNTGIGGVGKGHVLKRRLEYAKISDSNKDQDYSTLKHDLKKDIMVCYDIPEVIFASADSTFTNLREAKAALWTQTLIPICSLISKAIEYTLFQKKLKQNYKFSFNLDTIPELQDNLDKKLDRAQKYINIGVDLNTVNDIIDIGLPENYIADSSDSSDSSKSITKKQFFKLIRKHNKKKRIAREKRIPYDAVLKQAEYMKALKSILTGERKIYSAVNRFYRSKYKEAEKILNKDFIDIKKDAEYIRNQWIEEFDDWLNKQSWGDDLFKTVDILGQEIFRAGAKRTYAGVGATFNQPNLTAVTHMLKRMPKITNTPQKFIDIVKTKIADVMKSDSWTIDSMTKEIQKVWQGTSKTRATLISRTETTGAFNSGKLSGMKDLGIPKKEWLHSRDIKVRDSHRLEGEDAVVGVQDNFTLLDGEVVSYPGDGSAKNACNDRCTIISVFK